MVQQEEEEREAEWERRRAELTSQKEERGEEATEGKIAALQAAIKRNELIREGTLVRTATVAQTVLNSTRRWRKAGSAARLMVRLRSSSSAEPEPEPEPEADDAEEEEEEPEVSEADALLQWFNAAFEEAYGELEDCFKAGGVEFLGCELHACLRVAFVPPSVLSQISTLTIPYSLAFLLFRSALINISLLNVDDAGTSLSTCWACPATRRSRKRRRRSLQHSSRRR